MQLEVPDLRPRWRLVALGLGVALIIALILGINLDIHKRTGDTDDAMRLVMVRDLLGGQGWYDQLIGRLQPPHGLYMHWSRLLDGAIAGLICVYRLVLPAGAAEYLARVTWPLLWIAPAVVCALAIARSLGAKSAVLICAVFLLNLEIYRQFLPGRIDHHNVQIVATLVSLACAMAPSRGRLMAVGSGLATALGLAIGLEALPFHMLVGASWALAMVFDKRAARKAGAYGLALAVGSVFAFLAQTPPWRWGLTACDALGLNLVCALVMTGLGLALIGWRPPPSRLARGMMVGLCGLLPAVVCLALDPSCIHGPFAGVEVRARKLWLDTVQEVQPVSVIWHLDRAAVLSALTDMVMSLLGAAFIVVASRGRLTLRLWLALAALLLGSVLGCLVWRMMDYVFWIGLPVMAAAVSILLARLAADLLLPTIAAAVVLSPNSVAAVANASLKVIDPGHGGVENAGVDRCFMPQAFGQLAGLRPGVVLSEPDIGPFILSSTPHSVLAAPYHRMSRTLIAAQDALDSPPASAESRIHDLAVDYVVDCRPLSLRVRAGTLGALIRQDHAPTWLEPLSPRGAVLTIYAVVPRLKGGIQPAEPPTQRSAIGPGAVLALGQRVGRAPNAF